MVPTNTPFSLALSTPHKLIDEVAASSSSSSSSSGGTPLSTAVESAFRSAFPDADALSKIPYLTAENAHQLLGKTVRWRGMVQDNSLGNEMLPTYLSTRRCALYGGDSVRPADEEQDEGESSGNAAGVSPAHAHADLAERAVLFATSLPGRTPWAAHADQRGEALAAQTTTSASTPTSATSATPAATVPAPAATTPSSPPRTRTSAKLPLPDEPGALGVVLKLYDLARAEQLQVTDLVDVVGVLDRSALPGAEDWAQAGGGAAEGEGAEETQLPTLHVVYYDVIPDAWSDPARPKGATAEGGEDAAASSLASLSLSSGPTTSAEVARSAAIAQLAAVLCGDQDAAEWALLACIASVHTRKAPLALGHLSLRLILPASASGSASASFSPSPATALHSTLASLLPSVAPPLPLTLPHLNDPFVHLSPRSSGDSSGLSSSLLQLPRGTLLLVDEHIAEGSLAQHGLQNLQALQALLRDSALGYVFPFSPAPYSLNADLPTVLVSRLDEDGAVQGGLVTCDVDVPVVASAADAEGGGGSGSGSGGKSESVGTGKEEQAKPTAADADADAGHAPLSAIRRHLLAARRAARSLRVGPAVAEEIQRDFVRSRAAAGAGAGTSSAGSASASGSDGAEDTQASLLRRMDVARLLAASRLRTELTFGDYGAAVRMDEERMGRVGRMRAVRRGGS